MMKLAECYSTFLDKKKELESILANASTIDPKWTVKDYRILDRALNTTIFVGRNNKLCIFEDGLFVDTLFKKGISAQDIEDLLIGPASTGVSELDQVRKKYQDMCNSIEAKMIEEEQKAKDMQSYSVETVGSSRDVTVVGKKKKCKK